MTSVPPIPEEDEDPNLVQWLLFLRDYAKGNEWSSPPPPLSDSISNATKSTAEPLPAFDVPLYPPGEISPETARIIAEFYDRYGFLPPPRADEETIRLQTIQEYKLFREDQAENFHRCSSLVNTLFPFAPIWYKVFHNAVQVVVSKAGDFPVSLGEELVTETSICGHVVLKKNGETTELAEIGSDWRFTGNPWCSVSSTGVRGYVGVPITLEVDPSVPKNSERVTVGVIALMSNRPFRKLTDTQRKVLDDLSSMLSEMRLLNAVTDFLRKSLVEPSQQAIMDNRAASRAEPPVQGHESGRSTPSLRGVDVEMLTAGIFADAAEEMQELLEADLAVIVDLTSFPHNGKYQRTPKYSHSWLEIPGRQLKRRILGISSSPGYDDLEHVVDSPEAMAAVARFLDMYFVGFYPHFPPSSSSAQAAERGVNAFEPSGAVAHIAVPFYSANRPNILIVVATATPFFTFNPADVAFRTIVDADAAKTVSVFTHELRTPLHGLLGQLDLVRDSFSSGELATVPPCSSDSAEYCGTALRDIIDDVMHYGEMQSHDGRPPAHPPPTLVDTVRSCWLRQQQWQTVSAPSGSPYGVAEPAAVELVVEFEDRWMFNDWWITLDAPGFIQYTAEGLITVSLVSGPSTELADPQQITLRVEDTGCGIAPEFLNKLFDPFTQADSFSAGAGLGLHLTKTAVDRMGGIIAVESSSGGSIFTVKLPVDGIELAPVAKPRSMRRTCVSSERNSRSPELPLSPSRTPSESDKRLGHPPVPPPPISLAFVRLPTSSDGLTSPTSPTSVQLPAASDGPTSPTASSSAQIPTANDNHIMSCPTHVYPECYRQPPTASDDTEPHLTILVVDDNAISRKILVAMLKRLNTTTYQADDGINAIEVFKEVHPHVVWTCLPSSTPAKPVPTTLRMDGVTAAGEMRKIERERDWAPSHIVAITGLGLSDRRALLGPAALDGWIVRLSKGRTSKMLKESLITVRRKLRGLKRQSISRLLITTTFTTLYLLFTYTHLQ
ncbi:hypothetical protein B0H14DRAFT_2685385 [Mycena olivaceomarginata]|nr:hypothetical protein B0H14DRAFT_2685385 [Mycena olivaceomarginata]